MRYILIVMVFLSYQSYSQEVGLYKELNNSNVFMYTQINKDPVIISHGNILSEDILPNYTKGLQFMQAPGVFNSIDELYMYLTNNSKFYFENYDRKGSYYNKNSSHINERKSYYDDFVNIYNESLSYSNDDDALESPVWDLIGNVRYQLVFEEDYIKDSNYEFLILRTIHPFISNISVNLSSDIENVSSYFLRASNDEIIKKGIRSYCMIKEDGVWKACSAKSVFKYMQEQGYLQLVKDKVESINFYDVLSTVENGSRKYVLK